MITKVKSIKIKKQVKPSTKKKIAKKYSSAESLNAVKEPELLWSNYINKFICGDSLSVMKQMPSNSIDLIVTSPPYNLKNSTGNGMSVNTKSGKWAGAALQKGYSHYDDCMPHEKYVKWQNECLKEMFRLLKDDGAIFYNHKRRVQDGLET